MAVARKVVESDDRFRARSADYLAEPVAAGRARTCRPRWSDCLPGPENLSRLGSHKRLICFGFDVPLTRSRKH